MPYLKNKSSWNKGLHLTEEHKQKLRESKLNKPTRYWLGKKRSDEVKAKISENRKGKMTGSNHFAWTGDGKYSESYRERRRFRNTMQKKVFERDNYTCQKCGQHSGNLQVEHIKEWAKYPELRFDIDNCTTLCMDCHYTRHFNRKKPDGLVWGHNMCRGIES
jgi:5-methylcytosine-specific restriction endonuclease McrA